MLKPDSKYPNRRSYVLKLQSEATPDALAGRLENLVTGALLEFTSGDELLDSLEDDLAAVLKERPADRT
jgi:hypothetical protein